VVTDYDTDYNTCDGITHVEDTEKETSPYTHKGKQVTLSCQTDIDLAGQPDTRKSTSAYILYLNGTLFHWRAHTEKLIIKSTASSEYIALSRGNQACKHVREVLKFMGNTLHIYYLYTDNQAAEHLATQPNMTDNCRSIDIRHHEIKQDYLNADMRIGGVSSKDNTSDILTKSLQPPIHAKHCAPLHILTTHVTQNATFTTIKDQLTSNGGRPCHILETTPNNCHLPVPQPPDHPQLRGYSSPGTHPTTANGDALIPAPSHTPPDQCNTQTKHLVDSLQRRRRRQHTERLSCRPQKVAHHSQIILRDNKSRIAHSHGHDAPTRNQKRESKTHTHDQSGTGNPPQPDKPRQETLATSPPVSPTGKTAITTRQTKRARQKQRRRYWDSIIAERKVCRQLGIKHNTLTPCPPTTLNNGNLPHIPQRSEFAQQPTTNHRSHLPANAHEITNNKITKIPAHHT
jgi:hypothetical protein